MGLAIKSNLIMPLVLSRHVLKHILQRPLHWHDFAFMDPETYRQLQRLLEEVESYLRSDAAAAPGASDDPVAALGLVFTCRLRAEEGGVEVPLCANGAEREVTAASFHEYVRLYAQRRLEACKEACAAMRRGLEFMLGSAKQALALLSPEDFWLLLNGQAAGCLSSEHVFSRLAFVDGRRHRETSTAAASTTLSNFAELFQAVLEGMDSELLNSFLVFTTGSAGLPADPTVKIRVKVTDYSEMLPVAQSCFMNLTIPLYSNENMLREKLALAIHAETFELN